MSAYATRHMDVRPCFGGEFREGDGLVRVVIPIGRDHHRTPGGVVDDDAGNICDLLIGQGYVVTVSRRQQHRLAARIDVEVERISQPVIVDGPVFGKGCANGRDRSGQGLANTVMVYHVESQFQPGDFCWREWNHARVYSGKRIKQ